MIIGHITRHNNHFTICARNKQGEHFRYAKPLSFREAGALFHKMSAAKRWPAFKGENSPWEVQA